MLKKFRFLITLLAVTLGMAAFSSAAYAADEEVAPTSTATSTPSSIPYTLINNALSRTASENLGTEKPELYGIYMQAQDNKSYLSEGNIYAHPGEYTDYEIPPEALADADFAALVEEAEKYLGYPYVWGGSNPSESFDCSGFVCWVLNKSGTANVGRTNAYGLYGMSTVIPSEEAQPGDLIFFTGDRAAEIGYPVTHVGIYVGNGMMLHCASGGVQYSSISTLYWTKNFYAFGRVNGCEKPMGHKMRIAAKIKVGDTVEQYQRLFPVYFLGKASELPYGRCQGAAVKIRLNIGSLCLK